MISNSTEWLIATTERTENIIGHLFWLSIGKQMTKLEEIEQRITDSGLGKE